MNTGYGSSKSTRTRRDRAIEGAVKSVATALILGAGFLALFLGFQYFWVVWAIGFITVMPLLSILFGDHGGHTDRERNPSQSSTEAAIDSAFDAVGAVLADLDEAYHERVEPVFEEREERQSRYDYRTDRPNTSYEPSAGYDSRTGSTADALTVLRQRYARGDLTEAQFERKLDVLLETESPESADEWRRRNREAQIEK